MTKDTILSALTSVSDYDELLRYKPDTGSFEGYFHNEFNQFSSIEYGRGYQLHITNPQGARLTVTGTPANPGEGIPLSRGWNLIGIPTTKDISVRGVLSGVPYDDLRAYNTQTKQLQRLTDTDVLSPGKSYFIHCTRDTILILPQDSTQPNPATTFSYDADGNRIKKADFQATTIYIGQHYEVGPQGATKHIFLGNRKICSITQTTTTYYHPDHLGSTNLLTNEQGEVIEKSDYKPYGEFSSPSQPTTRPTTQNPSTPTNYYYTGKELDSTGLYYYGARYYSPAVGRFTQPDSIVQQPFDPQSLNRYAYTRNNPLRYTDPTGQSWQDIRNTTMSIFRQSQQWLTNTFSNLNTNIIQPMVSISKDIGTSFAHETQVWGRAFQFGMQDIAKMMFETNQQGKSLAGYMLARGSLKGMESAMGYLGKQNLPVSDVINKLGLNKQIGGKLGTLGAVVSALNLAENYLRTSTDPNLTTGEQVIVNIAHEAKAFATLGAGVAGGKLGFMVGLGLGRPATGVFIGSVALGSFAAWAGDIAIEKITKEFYNN